MDKINNKIKILTFNGTYLPGYKAGGPIRSIANMADRLKDSFDFYIVTQDRDFCDLQPYQGIKVDEWNKVRNEMVFYHSSENATIKNMKEIISDLDFDIVYLNGFFSEYTIRYLLLRKLKLIPNTPVIILPRGDLSNGALNLKRLKKRLYINLVKFLGLYKNLLWQATSDSEVQDIKNNFNNNLPIVKVGNLSASPAPINEVKVVKKKSGYLKIIFLSRITEVKNLKFALHLLNDLNGNIEFNIYGPISDVAYWEECQEIIKNLPQNVTVNYNGSIDHNEVDRVMKENNVLLLPTFGENFGHVIVEALFAGIPVLISDRTPWRELQNYSVGWDISLEDSEAYKKRLQYLVDLEEGEFLKFKDSTIKYVKKFIDSDQKVDELKNLFYRALQEKN
ncbi:glycosyltransferase family 4 protein [Niallia sp. Krafla_26]|uniref:glycosyltransferase family 4 protein n=1 Tax=Niallia sp. Krafla_26 TaxID=3064703 RepID=UPI003D182DCE